MNNHTEQLAIFLRSRRCARIDAEQAQGPYFSPAPTFEELSKDERDAYREVAGDALAFFVKNKLMRDDVDRFLQDKARPKSTSCQVCGDKTGHGNLPCPELQLQAKERE